MLKLLVPVVIILLLLSAGFYLLQWQNVQTPALDNKTAVAPPSPINFSTSDPCEVLVKGDDNLSPLYPGVSWSEPIISEERIVDYGLEEDPVAMSLDGCLVNSSLIDFDTGNKIMKYYSESSTGNGWREAVSADGPDGSMITYYKQGEYLLLDMRLADSFYKDSKYRVKLFYSN
ncbi:MAG: hypothetical protein WD988_01925 [Candidatus Curtissbacteria bacterium]